MILLWQNHHPHGHDNNSRHPLGKDPADATKPPNGVMIFDGRRDEGIKVKL